MCSKLFSSSERARFYTAASAPLGTDVVVVVFWAFGDVHAAAGRKEERESGVGGGGRCRRREAEAERERERGKTKRRVVVETTGLWAFIRSRRRRNERTNDVYNILHYTLSLSERSSVVPRSEREGD